VSDSVSITAVEAPLTDQVIGELAGVLVDCVEGGASVSFMAPFAQADGVDFFRKVAGSVASGDTVLLVAKIGERIVGTVQLGLDMPPNQPHRADVKKMLVHREARGRGIGAALLAALEQEAQRRGRWLLVLDTVTGDNGYRLYTRCGWIETGTIPDYPLFPDGRPCGTTIFYKRLPR
jgi:GNAT superfamily N-acetyltransferase